jgi:hypothetical protein
MPWTLRREDRREDYIWIIGKNLGWHKCLQACLAEKCVLVHLDEHWTWTHFIKFRWIYTFFLSDVPTSEQYVFSGKEWHTLDNDTVNDRDSLTCISMSSVSLWFLSVNTSVQQSYLFFGQEEILQTSPGRSTLLSTWNRGSSFRTKQHRPRQWNKSWDFVQIVHSKYFLLSLLWKGVKINI